MIKPMKLYAKNISTFKNTIGLKIANTPFISMPYGGYTVLSYNVTQASEEDANTNIYNNVNNQIQILNNYNELKISSTALKTNLNRISNEVSSHNKITNVKKKTNDKKVINQEFNNYKKSSLLNISDSSNKEKNTKISNYEEKRKIDLFEHIILNLKMNNMFSNVIKSEEINLKKRDSMNLSSQNNAMVFRSILEGSMNNYIDNNYKVNNENIHRLSNQNNHDNTENHYSNQEKKVSMLINEMLDLNTFNLNTFDLNTEENHKFSLNKDHYSRAIDIRESSNNNIVNRKSSYSNDEDYYFNDVKNIYDVITYEKNEEYLNYISSNLILQKYLSFEVLTSKRSKHYKRYIRNQKFNEFNKVNIDKLKEELSNEINSNNERVYNRKNNVENLSLENSSLENLYFNIKQQELDINNFVSTNKLSKRTINSLVGGVNRSKLKKIIQNEMNMESYKNMINKFELDIEAGFYDDKISDLFIDQEVRNDYYTQLEKYREMIRFNLITRIIKNAKKNLSYITNFEIGLENNDNTKLNHIEDEFISAYKKELISNKEFSNKFDSNIFPKSFLKELNLYANNKIETINDSVFTNTDVSVNSNDVFNKRKISRLIGSYNYSYELINNNLSYDLKEKGDSLENLMLLEEVYNSKRLIKNLNQRVVDNYNELKKDWENIDTRTFKRNENRLTRLTNSYNASELTKVINYQNEHIKKITNNYFENIEDNNSKLNSNYLLVNSDNTKTKIFNEFNKTVQNDIKNNIKSYIKENLINLITSISRNTDNSDKYLEANNQINYIKNNIENYINKIIVNKKSINSKETTKKISSLRIDNLYKEHEIKNTKFENTFYKKQLSNFNIENIAAIDFAISNIEEMYVSKNSKYAFTNIFNNNKNGHSSSFYNQSVKLEPRQMNLRTLLSSLNDIRLRSQILTTLSDNALGDKYNSSINYYNLLKNRSEYSSHNNLNSVAGLSLSYEKQEELTSKLISSEGLNIISQSRIQTLSENSFNNIISLLTHTDEISLINNLIRQEKIEKNIGEFGKVFSAYKVEFLNLNSNLEYIKTLEDMSEDIKTTIHNNKNDKKSVNKENNINEITKLISSKLKTDLENYTQIFKHNLEKEQRLIRESIKAKEKSALESKSINLELHQMANSYDLSQMILSNYKVKYNKNLINKFDKELLNNTMHKVTNITKGKLINEFGDLLNQENLNVFNNSSKVLMNRRIDNALKSSISNKTNFKENTHEGYNSYRLSRLVSKLTYSSLLNYENSDYEDVYKVKNIFMNSLSANENKNYVSSFKRLIQNARAEALLYDTRSKDLHYDNRTYDLLDNITGEIINKATSNFTNQVTNREISKITNKFMKTNKILNDSQNLLLDYNLANNKKIVHIAKPEKTNTLNQAMDMDYKTVNNKEEQISIKEFEKVSKEVIVLKEKIKDMETKSNVKKKTPKSKTRIFDSLSDKERLERQRRGDY